MAVHILLFLYFQDDLGALSGSDSTTFGDITVSLQNEDILPDYTIRTVKVILKCVGGKNLGFILKNLFDFFHAADSPQISGKRRPVAR